MEPERKPKILFIDDHPHMLTLFRVVLKRMKFEVVTSSSGSEALQIIQKDGPFHMVLSEYEMPGMNGAELLNQIRLRCPNAILALTSGEVDTNEAENFILKGYCDRFIAKPWKCLELMDFIREAMAFSINRSIGLGRVL